MKLISIKKIALSLVCFLVFSVLSVQAENALDNIEKNKVIRIGIPTDYPPYGFVGTDLQPQGLDVEMAQYIADKMKVRVELIPVISANRIPYLQTKKADLIISTLGKTPEREKVLDFSIAYAPFFQGVFAPKTTTIKSFSDLVGKSVAVTRGAMEDQELSKLTPPGVNMKRFEDNNATIAAFVSGQTDAVGMGGAVAVNIIKQNPKLGAEYKLLIKNSPCFIGIAKGEEELRLKVNAIINEAKKSGEIDKLSKKWLARSAGELPD